MEYKAFCTVTEVQSLLSTTAPDYKSDSPQMKECLSVAYVQIVAYLGRDFKKGVYTDTFPIPRTPNESLRVYTRNVPVVEDTVSLKFGGAWVKPDTYVDWTDGFLVGDLDRGAVSFPWIGSTSDKRMTITYTAGLDEIPVADHGMSGWIIYNSPDDLKRANAIQAASIMNKFLGNKMSAQKDARVKQDKGFPLLPEVKQMIAKYKRPKYGNVL